MSSVYRDRVQAGEVLASHLAGYRPPPEVTVLALPRGGIPVAYPIALMLDAPLDILAVRKLGVPGQEELAMGAIAAGGVSVLNREVLDHLHISADIVLNVTRREQQRLVDQQRRFRGDRPPAPVAGRLIVVVDDGVATGSTMEAAVLACREAAAARIVVAVPVGAVSTISYLATLADQVVCPATPRRFQAVGLAYDDFSPVSDDEVTAWLDRAGHRPS